jgi:hypothetical protein
MLRPVLRACFLAGALGVVLATRELPAQAAPPRQVTQLLAQRYPGWRLATVEPRLRRTLKPGSSPAWIAGDFDGDKKRDYAVQMVREDSAQVLLALLRRGTSFEPVAVASVPVSSGLYLRRAAAGERVRDLEADPNGDSTVVLQRDGIHWLLGSEAASTCRFDSNSFRCWLSGD